MKDRIERYRFVEGEDFIKAENLCSPNLGSKGRGGHNKTDYHLSLDMAKEVCMVDNSGKGRMARRYFINCERRLNESPARYLADMERQIVRLIEDRVEQTVALRLASNARVAALEYVSVRELLMEHNAVQKGRSGLNRKIGASMRAWALQTRPPISVRRCPHSGVWLFPRDFADDFMRRHGRELVHDHNDRQTGRGSLQLVVAG
ncbi:antA/AntB antirepressor family protein [Thalassospira mesophila]|uniref:antA/AntB antirepressor family protein n=1 Tax=Thalassospira mesophila TaxID=1293891 RepID=UPI003CCBEA49